MTHTPGPWSADLGDYDSCITATDPLTGHEFCVICMGHDYDEAGSFGDPPIRRQVRTAKEAATEREANIRLILAAPEMFELLQELITRHSAIAYPRVAAIIQRIKGEEVMHATH